VARPDFVYTAADRIADGGGSAVRIEVAQLSALAGPGDAAVVALTLA
jgi:hypothetical protein